MHDARIHVDRHLLATIHAYVDRGEQRSIAIVKDADIRIERHVLLARYRIEDGILGRGPSAGEAKPVVVAATPRKTEEKGAAERRHWPVVVPQLAAQHHR